MFLHNTYSDAQLLKELRSKHDALESAQSTLSTSAQAHDKPNRLDCQCLHLRTMRNLLCDATRRLSVHVKHMSANKSPHASTERGAGRSVHRQNPATTA